jgi:hypothetical protein
MKIIIQEPVVTGKSCKQNDVTVQPQLLQLNEMAVWPRDERTESKNSSRQSQSVEKKKEYPALEPGLTGAATLSPETFQWTFLSNPLLPERGQYVTLLVCFYS